MHRVFTPKSVVRINRNSRVTLLFLLLLFSAAPRLHAQGFGISKLKVSLTQKLPPAIYTVGTEVLVDVSSQVKINPQLLQRLQDGLELTLPRYDWRLNIVQDKPEIVLACRVKEMQATARSSSESRNIYKKVGEHTVTDNTGNSQIIEDYGYVQESFRVIFLEGHATVEYEIRDEVTGKMLEVRTINTDFRQAYEVNAPLPDAAYPALTESLIQQIARRFMPTFNSPITLGLPKGELKDASELLAYGLWNSALAELKKVKPFKKPEDEAYRLYALGVAYEGLAYESPDLASTKYYLEQAAIYYDDASQKNYDEAEIQNAAYRISLLLPSYKRLESAIVAYESKRQQKGLKTIETQKIHSYFGTSRVVTNATVMDWAKAGASEKQMLKRFAIAPAKYFDLSASGIKDLTGAGVKPAVIDAMRRTMIPNQYKQRSRYKWIGTTLTYALVYYPFLFIH
ncbi:MAG: hypothetical protein HY231_12835 [Acidobacteria bacterium]|nr:hypothetical protein [Acidobacteriota bacterium]